MTRLTLANRISVKLAAVVFVAAFIVVPARADGPQDLEIMVNGPWSFVTYNNQLFIVAPQDKTHLAYFWSSPDASMETWAMAKASNYVPISASSAGDKVYSLTFNNYLKSTQDPGEEPDSRYQPTAQVLQATTQGILHRPGTNRYALSLPMPDSVHTYTGDLGSGFSEAKISLSDPTSILPARYSTWTVLHYGLSSQIQSGDAVSVTLDGATLPGISIGSFLDRQKYNKPITRYGISIVLMEAPLCDNSPLDTPKYYGTDCTTGFPANLPLNWADDHSCDSLSGLSFALSVKLWGFGDQARFPQEDAKGLQSQGNYDYDCLIASAANAGQIHDEQAAAARTNLRVARDISNNVSELDSALKTQAVEAAESPRNALHEQPNLQKALVNISGDIKTLFPFQVPTELSNAFYCICQEVREDGKQSSKREARKSCRKLLPLQSPPKCVHAIEQQYLKTIVDLDKGSSDCHAPQISITEATQQR